MLINAALLVAPGSPLVIDAVDLEEPRSDEMLVRLSSSGVCHTDVIRADGKTNQPSPTPLVIGHEGAGVVEQVGAGVRGFAPGDHVVLTFDSCGSCDRCWDGKPAYCRQFMDLNFACQRLDGTTALSRQGEKVYGHFFGQSSFATHALARTRNAIKSPADLPLELAGPLGCGLQTGAGAVLNVCKPEVGSSLVVFGAGAVGLAAVMVAAAIGCRTIIAVDRVPERLDLARQVGATDVLLASGNPVAQDVIEITGHGANYALDTTGVGMVLLDAIGSLDELGTCVSVAMGTDPAFGLKIAPLSRGRSLRGTIEGDSVPPLFIPALVDLWREGSLSFRTPDPALLPRSGQ